MLFIAAAVGFVLHALLPGGAARPPASRSARWSHRRTRSPRPRSPAGSACPAGWSSILEGESLLNDATALVLFRVAVAAAVGPAIGPVDIAGQVVRRGRRRRPRSARPARSCFRFLHQRTTDPLIDNSLSLLTPFVVAVAAETVHASGVVAVVVAGLYLGHRMPTLMSAASRLQMCAFWQMVKFLLEGLVFLVVGLQLRSIVAELHTGIGQVVAGHRVGAATVVWAGSSGCSRRRTCPGCCPQVRRRDPPPPRSVPMVIGWAGMRGRGHPGHGAGAAGDPCRRRDVPA